MDTQTIAITGASDGIGARAAAQLVDAGHRIIVVGRSPDKTRAVAEKLDAEHYVADFSDLSQVRSLAAWLTDVTDRIDVLANNAGGLMGSRRVTVDGYESTFQVNHLAGFLLTGLLWDRLTAGRGVVVQTSSLAARTARLDPSDLQSERRFKPFAAYGKAKLANILFTRELDRRHRADGISAVCFHPGIVASNFASEGLPLVRWAYRQPLVRRIFTTPDHAARRLTSLALGQPGTDWERGEYYVGARVGHVSAAANDATLAKVLWDESELLVDHAW